MKENLGPWMDIPPKIYFHFLPTKESCQPRVFSLTKKGNIQETPSKNT